MSKTRLLTATGLFAALITVGTLYLKVPVPPGYYHLGDGLIYTAAVVVGAWPAAFAASLGSSLADVLGGAAVWWPWTFVIKGATALVVGSVSRGSASRALPAMILGALLTVAGYAVATAVIYNPAAALVETLGNLIQTGVGVVVGLVLIPVASRAYMR